MLPPNKLRWRSTTQTLSSFEEARDEIEITIRDILKFDIQWDLNLKQPKRLNAGPVTLEIAQGFSPTETWRVPFAAWAMISQYGAGRSVFYVGWVENTMVSMPLITLSSDGDSMECAGVYWTLGHPNYLQLSPVTHHIASTQTPSPGFMHRGLMLSVSLADAMGGSYLGEAVDVWMNTPWGEAEDDVDGYLRVGKLLLPMPMRLQK